MNHVHMSAGSTRTLLSFLAGGGLVAAALVGGSAGAAGRTSACQPAQIAAQAFTSAATGGELIVGIRLVNTGKGFHSCSLAGQRVALAVRNWHGHALAVQGNPSAHRIAGTVLRHNEGVSFTWAWDNWCANERRDVRYDFTYSGNKRLQFFQHHRAGCENPASSSQLRFLRTVPG